MSNYSLINENTVAISGKYYEYDCKVTLNESQIQSGIAEFAWRKEQTKHLFDCRGLDKIDAERVSLNGVMGEIAFAVKMGIPFSGFTGPGPDFQVSGFAVDVKASNHPNLLVAERHYHEDWLYSAVQQETNKNFNVLGYIHADELKGKPLTDLKNERPPAWLTETSKLHPFKAFIGKEKRREGYVNGYSTKMAAGGNGNGK